MKKRSLQERIFMAKLRYKCEHFAEVARTVAWALLHARVTKTAGTNFEDRGTVEWRRSREREERKSPILNAIDRSPKKSANRLSPEVVTPRASVERILREGGLKPHRPQL